MPVPANAHKKYLFLLGAGLVGGLALGISLGTHESDLDSNALLLLRIIGALYLAPALILLVFNPFSVRLGQIQARVSRELMLPHDALAVLVIGLGLNIIGSLTAGVGPNTTLLPSIPLWLLGMLLVYLSLRGRETSPGGKTYTRIDSGILIMLLVTGGIFRTIGLERMPYVMSGDEGSFGLVGWEFIDGSRNNLLGLGWFSFPSLYPWLLSLSQAIFGRTVFAIRLVSAIAGTLTIGGTYLAGRVLFNRRVGLIAAAWLATYHYHVFFSRIAYNNIFDGLFLILCITFLFRGWVKDRRNDFILLGLLLGFSQYFYTTSHAIPFILLLSIPWLHFRQAPIAHRSHHIIACLIVASCTALPLITVYMSQPESLAFTASRVSMLDPSLLGPAAEALGMSPFGLILEQTLVTGLGLTVSELQGIYLDSGVPMLFGLSAVIFTVALVISLIHWKRTRIAILLITVLLSIVIGGLSIQAPSSQRLILMPPVLALMIATAVDAGQSWLKRKFPRFHLPIAVFAIIALGWMNFENARQLFTKYFPEESYGSLNGEVANEIARILENESVGVDITFIGGKRMQFDSIPSITYLRPGFSATSIEDPETLQLPPVVSRRTIIFVLPEQGHALKQISSTYPGAPLIARYNRHGRLLFYLSTLDPGN